MTAKARGELAPGGLAMVYGLKRNANFNGAIVVTLKKGVKGEEFRGCVYEEEGGWLCTNETFDDGHEYFLPRNLLPIHPEADPLDIAETMEQRA